MTSSSLGRLVPPLLPITNRQSLGLLWGPRFESKQTINSYLITFLGGCRSFHSVGRTLWVCSGGDRPSALRAIVLCLRYFLRVGTLRALHSECIPLHSFTPNLGEELWVMKPWNSEAVKQASLMRETLKLCSNRLSEFTKFLILNSLQYTTHPRKIAFGDVLYKRLSILTS